MALVVKNLPANGGGARDGGLIPESGRFPGEGNGNPLQYSCLEKSHAQRSLVGVQSWDCKELDMTEHTAHILSFGEIQGSLSSGLCQPFQL